MGDDYNDRTYRTMINVADIQASCATDDNNFVDRIGLFNKEQIAQLLTILNKALYEDTNGLETDQGSDSMNTAVESVKTTLSALSSFTGIFAPSEWINPLNIDLTAGDSPIVDKLNSLMHEITRIGSENSSAPVVIQTLHDYNMEVAQPGSSRMGTDGTPDTTPIVYAGLTVPALFAAALAFDIDPYDPNPSVNIPSANKAQWVTISTEIINMVLMLMTIEYIKINSNANENETSPSQNAQDQATIQNNYTMMNSTIDTNISVSQIFKKYVNTGNWEIGIPTDEDGNRPPGACAALTPDGDPIYTYQDFIRTFSQDEVQFSEISPRIGQRISPTMNKIGSTTLTQGVAVLDYVDYF